MAVWNSNATGALWDILTVEGLSFPSVEVVAAYDGKNSVRFIHSTGSVLMLNLDSNKWKRTFLDPISNTITRVSGESIMAFNLNLKFCTALG